MSSADNQERLEGKLIESFKIKELRFLWFVWAGCLATVLAFLLVSVTIARQLREDIMAERDFSTACLSYFLILGFAFPLTAYLLRKSLIAGKPKDFKRSTEQIATRTNKPVCLVRYRIGAYLSMVISIAPAVCGFGIYVCGGNAAFFYMLLGIATLSLAYYRPRRADIVAMIRRDKTQGQAS